MKAFIKLSKKDKLNIFDQVSEKTGLPSSAVEKDWNRNASRTNHSD